VWWRRACSRCAAALGTLKFEGRSAATAVNIIRRGPRRADATESPKNSGIEGAVVVNKVRRGQGSVRLQRRRPAPTKIWSKAGVIDPTKVVRVALPKTRQSVASLMLTNGGRSSPELPKTTQA